LPVAAPEQLAGRYFSHEEIERARRYHRPLYRVFALSTAFSLAYPAVLAFAPVGRWLAGPVDSLPRWAFALSYTAMVVAIGAILRLPLSYWRGFVYEHQWDFSTQSRRAWLVDWLKGLLVNLVLTSAIVLGFIELAAALHDAWPLAAAPAAVALTVFLSFVAPVVLEPIFNKFEPMEDREFAAELFALAERARTPVKEILVADASRRTKKENAYVSGLGRTRRVVIYDTLLARGPKQAVKIVTAHELGHRRDRHVAWGTLLGAIGTVIGVVILWALLQSQAVLNAVHATGPADPHVIPFLLFAITAMEVVSMPLGTAISRRWEAAADRISIELTQDREGFVEMEHDLAVANLSDLEPPRILYLWVFTHPTPPERIEAAVVSLMTPTTA
jgi:Zn-dependent protease with chaperone function